MPTVHETVYPRLKSALTRRELVDLYTPTEGELELAERSSKGEPARLGFLVLLKTFQRLGYFVALRDVPRCVVEHIGHDRGMLIVPETADYDDSGTRRRHAKIIRQYLRVKSFDETARVILSTVVRLAAERMEDLADIINVAVEELIRASRELNPAQGSKARTSRGQPNHLPPRLGRDRNRWSKQNRSTPCGAGFRVKEDALGCAETRCTKPHSDPCPRSPGAATMACPGATECSFEHFEHSSSRSKAAAVCP